MISSIKSLFFITILCFISLNSMALSKEKDPGDPNKILTKMLYELEKTNRFYLKKKASIRNNISTINGKLHKEISVKKKVDLLVKKDFLKTRLNEIKIENAKDITKIRYIKGLEIIRLLYEKILSLDHHFASVATFSEINKMSNPNQYQEYEKLKSLIKSERKRKDGIDLTSVLGTNTLVSLVGTFSNMMVSNLSKEEKEKELENIDCILDFTLRMQNDLNTIYFETALLQNSNATIKEDIENLFVHFTKPIDYDKSLEKCRNYDDWSSLRSDLKSYLEKMKNSDKDESLRLRINLEFPIDRLIQFINQYNDFINKGEDFYQKFKIMLNSYENEKQCETELPVEYKKLKSDIDIAIEKFKVAYKPIQINGSKMKQLLYGINEYE